MIGFPRLRQPEFPRERDHATQLGIEARNALQVDVSEPFGTELARLDPTRKLPHRGERDVGIVCRQGAGICIAADKAIARRTSLVARQSPVHLRIGSYGFRNRQLARTATTLVKRSHAIAPVLRGFRAIPVVEFHSHELFSLCKSCRRDLRPNGGRRAERGRRSGRWRRLVLDLEIRRDRCTDKCSR